MNPDSYFGRKEVSNSDLTALDNYLHPHPQYGDIEQAFKFGTLLDAIITEAERVNYFRYTVDGVVYTPEDFERAKAMRDSIRKEAQKDAFLKAVLEQAHTQEVSVRHDQRFQYGNFNFELDTRCKWDWFFPYMNFGGDLKSTACETQKQFEEACRHFDYDRSRAWYMDIVGSQRDFIYGVSKKNFKVFKVFINRGDDFYNAGYNKYTDLAFKYWILFK